MTAPRRAASARRTKAEKASADDSIAGSDRAARIAPAAPESPAPSGDGSLFDGQYRIKLESFEGPLDLLLHLIQQHELDILDIPVSFITEKYLEYLKLMQVLSIEIASEYLVMAATLVHIKSKMLLPVEPTGQDDGMPQEEEEDPRAELVRRLLEYQKYKAAAAELAERGTLGRDVFPRGVEEAEAPGPAEFAKVEVFSLLEAFERILKKAKVKIDHEVVFDRISITDRIVELTEKLQGRRAVRFEWLFLGVRDAVPTRFDLVITFLAMLEMCRMKLLRVYQTGPLAPIYMGLVEGVDELSDEDREEADRTADQRLAEVPDAPESVEQADLPIREGLESVVLEEEGESPVLEDSESPVLEEEGESPVLEGAESPVLEEDGESPVLEEEGESPAREDSELAVMAGEAELGPHAAEGESRAAVGHETLRLDQEAENLVAGQAGELAIPGDFASAAGEGASEAAAGAGEAELGPHAAEGESRAAVGHETLRLEREGEPHIAGDEPLAIQEGSESTSAVAEGEIAAIGGEGESLTTEGPEPAPSEGEGELVVPEGLEPVILEGEGELPLQEDSRAVVGAEREIAAIGGEGEIAAIGGEGESPAVESPGPVVVGDEGEWAVREGLESVVLGEEGELPAAEGQGESTGAASEVRDEPDVPSLDSELGSGSNQDLHAGTDEDEVSDDG